MIRHAADSHRKPSRWILTGTAGLLALAGATAAAEPGTGEVARSIHRRIESRRDAEQADQFRRVRRAVAHAHARRGTRHRDPGC